MSAVTHPCRVVHIPQVPGPSYVAAAPTVEVAVAIAETLALQHLWLLENHIIPDYSNVIVIETWDGEEWEELDDENPVVAEFRERYEELTQLVAGLS